MSDAGWFHLYCLGTGCHHRGAILMIDLRAKWPGVDDMTLLARVRRLARCTACGRLGAQTMHPSWGGSNVGWAKYPGDLRVVPAAERR